MAMLQCDTVANYIATAPPLFLVQPSSITVNKEPKGNLETREILSDPVMSEKLRRLVALYDVLFEGEDVS